MRYAMLTAEQARRERRKDRAATIFFGVLFPGAAALLTIGLGYAIASHFGAQPSLGVAAIVALFTVAFLSPLFGHYKGAQTDEYTPLTAAEIATLMDIAEKHPETREWLRDGLENGTVPIRRDLTYAKLMVGRLSDHSKYGATQQ